ncbi:SLC13 family permease [Rarobacter incanus]|uniref:SLC13 family permease n=1 Tax=Rarobacter incanus TaxID=153494 RepID=UPI001B862E38|nr:SLC13 family permease [Rarobacter incanus]
MPGALLTAISLGALFGTLAFAVVRPRQLPEATASIPAALLLVAIGGVSLSAAWAHIVTLGPTLAFLAGALLLADLCENEGLFAAAGSFMAHASRGNPKRLFVLVFAVASVTTAVLNLDATVVLLTPVILSTATSIGARPKPHLYATAHLANSASLLLPVSNLTNLLALSASGLTFGRFAGLMFAPWLLAIATEYVLLRRYFRADLSVSRAPNKRATRKPIPRFALTILAATFAGFVVSSPLHFEPFWVAWAGALALLVRRLVVAGIDARRSATASRKELTGGATAGRVFADAVRAINVPFLAFVATLSIVVAAVIDHGAGSLTKMVVPHDGSLWALLAIAFLAAIAANLVNNLPATLMLLPFVAPLGPIAVLAALIGVNAGSNLTYVGSLATLLWRRIVARGADPPQLGEYRRVGLLTTPAVLILSTLGLWAASMLMGDVS